MNRLVLINLKWMWIIHDIWLPNLNFVILFFTAVGVFFFTIYSLSWFSFAFISLMLSLFCVYVCIIFRSVRVMIVGTQYQCGKQTFTTLYVKVSTSCTWIAPMHLLHPVYTVYFLKRLGRGKQLPECLLCGNKKCSISWNEICMVWHGY